MKQKKKRKVFEKIIFIFFLVIQIRKLRIALKQHLFKFHLYSLIYNENYKFWFKEKKKTIWFLDNEMNASEWNNNKFSFSM